MVYVSERGGHRIRRVDTAGVITTLAGQGIAGFGGDTQPARSAFLNSPRGLALGPNNRLYVADSGNNRVREINLATGVIRTVAGNGQFGLGADGSQAAASPMATPWGLLINKDGNLLVAEPGAGVVRIVALSTSTIRRIAGPPQLDAPVAMAQEADGSILISDRGAGALKRLRAADQTIETVAPIKAWGLALESDGSVLFSGDELESRISRLVALGGRLTSASPVQNLLGSGTPGRGLNFPQGVALDSRRYLFIADSNNHVVRRFDPASGDNRIFAGLDRWSGSGSTATQTLLTFPARVAIGPGGSVFIADTDAHCIRRVASGNLSTVAGSCGLAGFFGDGGQATQALLNTPAGLAVDAAGILYISDTSNGRIRRVDSSGQIGTLASGLGSPQGLAFSTDRQSLIVAAPGDNRLYKLDLAGGTPQSLLSNNAPGYQDGPAAQAQVRAPFDVAVDSTGSVLFADTGNNRIRKLGADGQVSTLAGNGLAAAGTDGNSPLASYIARPTGIALDTAGNILVSDAYSRIRRIRLAAGVVETIAGSPLGVAGPAADSTLTATSAFLNGPVGFAAAADGRIFVADTANHRVRELTPLTPSRIEIIGGNNQSGSVSSVLPQALAVRVVAARDIPLAGITVQFAVASGDAALSAASGTTLDDGVARVRVTLGPSPGRIAITATVEGLPPVQFDLTSTSTLPTPSAAVIVGGNDQQGPVSTTLPAPLAVRVTGGNPAVPILGVTVNYRVTSGTATLSASTATTDRDGVAAITVTLSGVLGRVVVSATVAGLNPLIFTLTATLPGIIIDYGGVVGAGSSVPPVRVLAPNSLISIYGSGFLPSGVPGRGITSADLVGGRLPTQLLGVCVTVGGIRAPLTAVYPGQVNAQVPAVTGSTADVRVLARCGAPDEAASNAETLPVVPSAPEFFYFAASTDGRSPVAAVDALTGNYIGPTTLGSAFRPAKPGDLLTVYLTGIGPTRPSAAPGEIPTAIAPASLPLRLQLGGLDVAPSDVLYVGVAPTLVIYQLNFRVPDTAQTGTQTLVLTVGDASSPPSAYVEVRK